MFLGWLSSLFYLSSRLSQLYKTWSRKCCEGLSTSMFLCAISANIRYADASNALQQLQPCRGLEQFNMLLCAEAGVQSCSAY